MSRASEVIVALALVAASTACVDNVAPGNDREAELDRPAPPAEVAPASEAIAGVDVGLLLPQIMTDADLAAAPSVGSGCRFRFTEVGFPVVVYGSSAVVKLNGKLVPLPGSTDGRYTDGGIEVTVRPVEAQNSDDRFEAEFVLRLPGAPNELGFRGYAECGASPGTA